MRRRGEVGAGAADDDVRPPEPEAVTRSGQSAVLVVVAIIAGLAATIWVALSLRPPTSDALMYFTLAKQLVAGQGYVWMGIPTAYWNPGYPLALAGLFAVFGPAVVSAVVLNIVLHMSSAVLAAILAIRLGTSRWLALTAGVIVGLYPDKLFLVSQLLAENLAVPLVLLIALCWIAFLDKRGPSRMVWITLVGALVGALTLTRTVALALLPLFVLVTWFAMYRRRDAGRRILSALAVLVLGFGLVVGPWLVRNYVVFGTPTISTISGANLLIGLRAEPAGTFQADVLEPKISIKVPQDEVRADRAYMSRAIALLKENPALWTRIPAANLRGLFSTPRSASDVGSQLNTISRLLVPVRVILVLVSTLVLFWRSPPASEKARSIAVLCLTWALVHVLLAPIGSVRYMVPIAPLMIVLSAYFVGLVAMSDTATGDRDDAAARSDGGIGIA